MLMKKNFFLAFACAILMASGLVAQNESPSSLPSTVITFDEPEYDFGEAEQGEIVSYIFRFTNTGKEPLQLTNAKGSCGCTVPSWPQAPIQPGGTGAIVVEFDTKGKMGRQTKMVTITANTDPVQSLLYLKGEIFTDEAVESGALEAGDEEAESPIATATANKPHLAIYPNPTADGLLWLSARDAAGAANLEIYTANGQLVGTKEATIALGEPLRLDLSDYLAGTYWLSVKIGDNARSSLPFVIAKK